MSISDKLFKEASSETGVGCLRSQEFVMIFLTLETFTI